MRDSTRQVREMAMKISYNYFNNKKRYASIQNGEAAFMNRAKRFLAMAHDLESIAETPRAHETVSNLITVINRDVNEVRAKWFDK